MQTVIKCNNDVDCDLNENINLFDNSPVKPTHIDLFRKQINITLGTTDSCTCAICSTSWFYDMFGCWKDMPVFVQFCINYLNAVHYYLAYNKLTCFTFSLSVICIPTVII